MSITDRDKKIILLLVPALLLAAYWFLMLSPKRDEAAIAKDELVVQEQRRDIAQQNLDQLQSNRTDFAADYAEIVRLGKAVPATVDMPTLLVQLEAAAEGTKIDFMKIATGDREAAPVPTPAAPAAPGTGDGSQPAAAGGETAQSAPGAAAEAAGNTVAGANNASTSAEQSGIDPADTATSTDARDGALPDGSTAPTGTAALETVPLTLEFSGDFFDLADFFHKLKRYVESSKEDLLVRGRLMTVDGISLKSEPDTFPKLSAEITATVYLAPKTEGPTAGATPEGPSTTLASGESDTSSGGLPTPTAAATR